MVLGFVFLVFKEKLPSRTPTICNHQRRLRQHLDWLKRKAIIIASKKNYCRISINFYFKKVWLVKRYRNRIFRGTRAHARLTKHILKLPYNENRLHEISNLCAILCLIPWYVHFRYYDIFVAIFCRRKIFHIRAETINRGCFNNYFVNKANLEIPTTCREWASRRWKSILL